MTFYCTKLLTSDLSNFTINFTSYHHWAEFLQHQEGTNQHHCTSIRCHLPAAGRTGALVWFKGAPFQAPFDSAYQIQQKKPIKHPSCEQTLLHSSAFSASSFQYHGKFCRTVSPCWETLIWKDKLPEWEIITNIKILDTTSRCFSAVEILVHGQRKRERLAQSFQYLHRELNSF